MTGVLHNKLRPEFTPPRAVSPRLRALLRPRPGCLLLVHAGAGYGKTTVLAATQQPEWIWYTLDRSDQSPWTLAQRLCIALGIPALAPDLPQVGETIALELADRLQGRSAVVTLDRYERLGESPEVGRLLSEMLRLTPGLALRVATRVRPDMPLRKLQLEGRLMEAGPDELRLRREEIERFLAKAPGGPAEEAELDFADQVLAGWPAAIKLWRTGDVNSHMMPPLQPGEPLYDYIAEEIVEALPDEVTSRLRGDSRWLLSEAGLQGHGRRPGRRIVVDRLIKDRIGVVPDPAGWRLHPLFAAFLSEYIRAQRKQAAPTTRRERPGAEGRLEARTEPPQVSVRTFGGLGLVVDGAAIADSRWPTASRRLLQLLLCLPGYQTTAREAARLLWPRYLPSSALNSFNVAVHGLRRVLEPDLRSGPQSRYLVREGHTYRLVVERLDLDVEEFLRLVGPRGGLDEAGARGLESAIGIYRGDFLSGYEEEEVWDEDPSRRRVTSRPTTVPELVQERRTRLQKIMLDTMERIAAWRAGRGEAAEALDSYNRLLELRPHREDLWSRILELHLAAGDRLVAMEVLSRCEQTLEAAGIEPSSLLRDLRDRIR